VEVVERAGDVQIGSEGSVCVESNFQDQTDHTRDSTVSTVCFSTENLEFSSSPT